MLILTNEAAEAPNATDVEPSVTALFDNCAFVTFAKAPPNVIVGSTVSPSDTNVIPFSLPVADTVCTVPEPNPEAAILIPPAEFVTVIFAPPVKVANTGSAPVLPTTNWPFVAWPRAVTAPVPLPRSTPPSVKVDVPVPPEATGKAVPNDSDAKSAARSGYDYFFPSCHWLIVF